MKNNKLTKWFKSSALALGASGLVAVLGIGYVVWSSPGTTTIGENISVGGNISIGGNLSLQESVAPSATANQGKLYVKSSDSKLYYLDDSGTEINITTGGAGTYTETASGPTNCSVAGVWEDWDLSSIVPIGTKYAEVYIAIGARGGQAGVRAVGSALNRYFQGSAHTNDYGPGFLGTLTVAVSGDRRIQRYCSTVGGSTAPNRLYVTGYWQ